MLPFFFLSNMKPYIVTDQIHLYEEQNYLKVGQRVMLLSDVKEYILTYHKQLANQFKLKSRTHYDKHGRLHVYYAWDGILSEALKRKFLLSMLGKEGY